jgi:nicotinamidase-related amidase
MTHMCCDATTRQAVHREFTVEFLSDARGTLYLSNAAGDVSAEELQRAILCEQQMMLSKFISTDLWCKRIA